MSDNRIADYPVDPQFIRRWSPRAYTAEPIARETLLTLLEAARWAPSAFNAQPWRFVYAHRDTEHWAPFLALLSEYNRDWVINASALVIVISTRVFIAPGQSEPQPHPTHAFDAGAAWVSLALQAELSGWSAHAMAGLDRDKARALLGLAEDYEIQAAVAIGRRGDPGILSDKFRERETPSPRTPLARLAAEGIFTPDIH